MSVIKIRGWHTVQKKMFSCEQMAFDQLTLLTTGSFINVSGYSKDKSVIYPSDKFIPLLWSGLKYKKTTDIYDGDVFNFKRDKSHPDGGRISGTLDYYAESAEVVSFKNGCFFAGNDYLHNRLFWYERHNWHLIGNIYENPELIENNK